jgi:hypothetical protein
MNELRDRIEMILTVGVALGAIALAWVVVSVVVGMSFGLAVRAANWIM